MYSLGTFFPVLITQLPVLAVAVIGLVLLGTAGRRGLPARALLLARAGLAVLLAEIVVSAIWAAGIPRLISLVGRGGAYGTVSLMIMGSSLVLAFLSAVGLALLVGALLAARQPAPPPASVPAADGQ